MTTAKDRLVARLLKEERQRRADEFAKARADRKAWKESLLARVAGAIDAAIDGVVAPKPKAERVHRERLVRAKTLGLGIPAIARRTAASTLEKATTSSTRPADHHSQAFGSGRPEGRPTMSGEQRQVFDEARKPSLNASASLPRMRS